MEHVQHGGEQLTGMKAIVASHAVGVCGTDLHIIDGDFPPTPVPDRARS